MNERESRSSPLGQGDHPVAILHWHIGKMHICQWNATFNWGLGLAVILGLASLRPIEEKPGIG